MRRSRLLVVLSLFLTVYLPLSAQPYEELQEVHLSVDYIGIEDGLSQGMVYSCIQDKRGFIWIATKDGLNKYDGYQFVVFRHKPGTPNSLSDNHINYLHEDSKGRIWAATNTRGLDLFDPVTERFYNFSHKDNEHNSISSNNVSMILEDIDGSIWIRMAAEWNVMRPVDSAGFQYDIARVSVSESFNIRSKIRSIHIDSRGNKWISTSDSLMIFKSSSGQGAEASIRFPVFHSSSDINNPPVVIYEDKAIQKIYLASSLGIVVFDSRSIEVEDTLKFNCRERFNIFSMVKCPDGRFLIGTNLSLMRYDPSNSSLQRLTLDNNGPAPASPLHTSAFLIDNSGMIWFSNSGYGVCKYHTRREKFSTTRVSFDSRASVYEITEDRKGRVFLSAGNGSDKPPLLFQGGRVQEFFNLNEKQHSLPGYLGNLVLDAAGYYWLNYSDGIIVRYHEKSGEYKIHRTGELYGFSNDVDPLFQDRDGFIWFADGNRTPGNTLHKIDPLTMKLLGNFPFPKCNEHWGYQFLSSWLQLTDGTFVLGTNDGVFLFNEKKMMWKQYSHIDGDASSLSVDMVFSLARDPVHPDQIIWVGTNGGGLDRLDLSTGKVTHFSEADGLPNNVVYGILADKGGSLWMSTNKGICKLNPANRILHSYQERDGLQSNEFNRYSYLKGSDGLFYFGGVNGFNYFDPAEIKPSERPSKLNITSIELFNRPLNLSTDSTLLSCSVPYLNEIQLKHDQNMFTIRFASMDFTNPSVNRFRFKLEGFDEDWIENGTQNQATYTNLDPGNYVFKVLGTNSDGMWNTTPAVLHIYIKPPYYMTWWFKLLVLFGLTGLSVYSVYWISSRRLRRRLEAVTRQNEIEHIRSRISRDIHDDIGSGLTRISLLGELLKVNSANNPSVIPGQVDKIIGSARQLIGNLGEIVWSTNPEHDNLSSLLGFIRNYANDFFDETNIDYVIDFPVLKEEISIHPDLKRNVFLVIKEALNNSLKYSSASRIRLSCKLEGNSYVFIVEDNGCGFDPSKLTGMGNGLKNMKRRMEVVKGHLQIESSPGNGTIVKISGDLSV